MDECSICIEKFNKSTRKKVSCTNCECICCRECHQTYLFSRDVIDCMFCNAVQSFEQIKNSHFDTFIKSTGSWKGKGFREHQEEVFFKNEMSMFPETLALIEQEDRRNAIYEEIKDTKKLIITLKFNLSKYITNFQKEIIYKKSYEIDDLYKEKDLIQDEFKKDIQEYQEKLTLKNNEIIEIYNSQYNTPSKKKTVNVLNKCMSSDCDGYLNSKWCCKKCDKETCKDCREIVQENHKCDQDIVKTIKLAISTSKPCPVCSERIHRIYGCDQVYCPMCKIVFSYSTGVQQIGGVIHQPDAVKELRKNGKLPRDIRDIPCGGINYILHSNHLIFPFFNYPKLKRIIMAIVRWATEYEDMQQRGYNNQRDLNNLNNFSRNSFLRGNITKENFKKEIYKSYKRYEKETEDLKIKAGLYICIADMLRSLQGMEGYENIYNHLCEMFILFETYNGEFTRNYKVYNITSSIKIKVLKYSRVEGVSATQKEYIYMYVSKGNIGNDDEIVDLQLLEKEYKALV